MRPSNALIQLPIPLGALPCGRDCVKRKSAFSLLGMLVRKRADWLDSISLWLPLGPIGWGRVVMLLGLMAVTVHPRSVQGLEPPGNMIHLAWLKVPGSGDPSSALAAWAQEIRLRTSVDIATQAIGIRPEDPAIFHYPLLYWSGDKAVAKLSDQAVANLRLHLSTGGLLVVDNVGRTEANSAFDTSIRAELQRIFPQPMQRLNSGHVLFRSFYRLDQPVGRRADTRELEGIRVSNHYVVLYTRNDLAGALQRSQFGGFALSAVPGGESQREQAFRLAVNLVMYALCLDYKDDHTHVMHLLRNRRGSHVPAAVPAAGAEE